MEEALDATLGLLREKTFEDVSISEILERAGQSTGQFYARFANKEAVFVELCRRFEGQVQARVTEEIETWDCLSLRERVRHLVALVVSLNIEHRPVLRSMLLRIWRDPGGQARLAGEVRDESFEELLLRHLDPGAGTGDPTEVHEPTARWVVETVAATARHELLFGELFDAGMEDPRVQEMVTVLTELAVAGLKGRVALP